MIHSATGEHTRALTLARSIARAAPRNLSAQVILAYVARIASQTKEAEAAVKAAWVLAPDGIAPSSLEALLVPQRQGAPVAEPTLDFNADQAAAVPAAPASYLAQLQEQVARFWSPPANLRAQSEAEYVRERAALTAVRLTIDEAGRVSAADPVILSGLPELDETAIVASRSVRTIAQLPPEAPRPLRVLLRFSVPLRPLLPSVSPAETTAPPSGTPEPRRPTQGGR